MLPALGRLRLSRTGEFYPLSDSEVNRFAEEERQDPITLEDFQTDDGDTWRTFRVRSETPGADGEYTHFYYSAAALWRHYNSATHVVDPLTRQPIWYEDWVALHDAYAPSDSMRLWVYSLPTRDPGTVKAQPPPPPPHRVRVFAPPLWMTADELRARRMEVLEADTPPSSPTPIWVYRQPNRPQLSDEDRESERLYAARNRARERFGRMLQLDDSSFLEALRDAIDDTERAGEAIQEFLDRLAAGETDPNGLRTLQARSELYGRRGMAERMQRQVDEARARWQGRARRQTP
jgi:hypothetical protein